jgi:MoaA/NifB/PqqE/SkfB family radical SAM enzyme
MSAFAGADTRGELTTAECRRVIDEIATVNPNVFLILTGGEPLLRKDLFGIAAYAAEQRFTTVFGTNGVLLREKEAALMRQHGVLGASISLDSTDRAKHDAFRRLPGAWDGAVRATRVLADAGLDFSLHMSVTDWNVGEVPAMIDLARKLGAKVLNFFFLVRTGRGRDLTDIDGPPSFVQRLLGRSPAGGSEAAFEDPWSTPVARSDSLLIRAKCAPHFRRILWELNPSSALLNSSRTTRTGPVPPASTTVASPRRGT